MRDVINHLSICDLSQVLKSSKGELDKEIPVPSFVADPSHNVKVVSKQIFSIANYGKYH